MGMQREATSSISDVGADMSSTDSLSFTGLVCIQDHQQHLTKPHQIGQALLLPPPAAKHNPEFEFISHSSSTTSSSATGSSPRRVTPADLLFSNGQLLPQAIPFPSHSDHSVPSHTPSTRRRSSRRTASGSELGSSNKAAAAKKKPNNTQVRNYQASCNKDGSFGQKIFKSISAPCRGCRALEPSKSMRSAAQTLSQ